MEPFTKYGIGILIGQIFQKRMFVIFFVNESIYQIWYWYSDRSDFFCLFVYKCLYISVYITSKKKNGKMVKMKNDFFCVVTKRGRKVLKKKGYVFYLVIFYFLVFYYFLFYLFFKKEFAEKKKRAFLGSLEKRKKGMFFNKTFTC